MSGFGQSLDSGQTTFDYVPPGRGEGDDMAYKPFGATGLKIAW